ncbi:MAG TPA: M20/M25/M40 family metallo-hydrolase [Hyphomonadaceae bacterium]|nr:M20/M25/M40 family metallo-hydrolase [Hyphomonadaceae bacterium]
MFRALAVSAGLMALAAPALAQVKPDEQAFRDLYKELVETNTSLSVGSCTEAATKMAARLKAAGYSDDDARVWTEPSHPKEGGLIAKLAGSDANAKPVLMLAHIDVVEAKREDWTRDPFKLVEEGGYFYGRGSSDDKAMASIWVDTLIRYRKEGFKPKRTIKLALTCGEETNGAFNGAEWLSKNHKDWIDAEFAINEGGGGQLDASGKPVFMGIMVGEKLSQNYTLEVTNPGGHSSRPLPDNAINQLAEGLTKIAKYRFPVVFNDTTRGYFTEMAKIKGGETAKAMTALMKNPKDAAADKTLSANPDYNRILRTTCIATMLDAGHATNALPQRARANINCRIFPGTTVEEVRKLLETIVKDKAIKVTVRDTRNAPAPPPPLNPSVIDPAQKLAKEMYPGVPNLLTMAAGATDGAFLTPVGIPTYGISGSFGDNDGNGVHGLNERIRVKSLMDSREYLYRLMKAYAG